MINRYRSRPKKVWALQFDGKNNKECEKFIGIDNIDNTLDYPNIKTTEGTMCVSEGDWIVKGTDGEFYPVKPHIFLNIYEAVGQGEPA